MTSNKLSQSDVVDVINALIAYINHLLATYTFPGIVLVLIGVGLILLFLTYLPYILGVLALILVGYFAYLKLR